jgi:fructosamine-3-kinase
MVPEAVQRWLSDKDFGEVISASPVGGGCINNGACLRTSGGRRFFLKTNRHAAGDMFACEAEGLQALRIASPLHVPEPYLHGPHFLLMEDLAPAPRKSDYWEQLGSGLAKLHQHTASQFGFAHDNYIGSTPQPNRWTADGHRFFAEQRLLHQAGLARRSGLLASGALKQVERLAGRLGELVPVQPASLIHGDLWSGNAVSDSTGGPALIDPAAHYGWAEAELAMTALFGAFPAAFYRAYQQVRPLEPGYEARCPIYNLYHLLNHLNLFGEGYLGEVLSVLRLFA